VYFLPIAFTACEPHSAWSKIAFFFTSSGGPQGFLILLILTGYFYSSSQVKKREKVRVFLLSVFTLMIFFGSLAWINENYTKPVLKLQRPSHVYMLDQIGARTKIDTLYLWDKQERQKYFNELLLNNPLKFQNIDNDIQAHWVEEAGFSFPSGHTYNAFLFAMLIAYAIYYNRNKVHLRKWYVLPFLWAYMVGVSRVAMGAHSALDVSVGALLGILTACLFLYVDITRHWLTRKD
jgi:phosphatidylglycerophosphatase B